MCRMSMHPGNGEPASLPYVQERFELRDWRRNNVSVISRTTAGNPR